MVEMVNFIACILFFLMFCLFFFFGCVASEILVHQPESKPIPAAWEGRDLTTGPLGKSPIVCILPQLKNNKLIQNKI